MLGKRFARIVEECLHRLDRGENLPDVLADYPADSEQLKPLLLVAMASRSLSFPLPSQTSVRSGKNLMLAEMDEAISPTVPIGTPPHLRVKEWATHLLNAKRAQRLIQPAPSYRLAIIALVVVFGSGLIFLSASASTSPGEFFTTFSIDFQKVLEIFNHSFDGFSITDGSRLNKSIKISGGEELPSGGSGNEKVVVLLDVEEDDSPSYVYLDPYQEKHSYNWGEPQNIGVNFADEEESSKKDQKQEEKDLKKAELDAEKAAKEAEREAAKTLREQELADKLEQKKAAIEAKQEDKIVEKEEKEKEKDLDLDQP